MLVLFARLVAVDTRGDGEPHRRIPTPGHDRLIGLSAILETSATSLADLRQMFGQIGFGEPPGCSSQP